MPRPIIGVPFHPDYTNAAFFQAMERLQNLGLNIMMLDCRYANMGHLNELAKGNMTMMDGLLLPGSAYDIDPKFYGETVNHAYANVAPDDRLTYYQLKMIDLARQRNMPILGLCAGANVLHIALGGKLIQNIFAHERDNPVMHIKDPRKGDLAHKATVKKGSHLHDILAPGAQEDLELSVSSWHNSANLNHPKVKVTAQASDGIIEGIEEAPTHEITVKDRAYVENSEQAPPMEIKLGETTFKVGGHPNCWGVQFHPEYVDEAKTPEEKRQLRIIEAFKTASLAYQVKRTASKAITHLFEHKSQVEVDGDLPKEKQSIKKAALKARQ